VFGVVLNVSWGGDPSGNKARDLNLLHAELDVVTGHPRLEQGLAVWATRHNTLIM